MELKFDGKLNIFAFCYFDVYLDDILYMYFIHGIFYFIYETPSALKPHQQ